MYRFAYRDGVVAFKMGRRHGGPTEEDESARKLPARLRRNVTQLPDQGDEL